MPSYRTSSICTNRDTPSGTLWERIRQADASQPELEAIRTLADQTLIYTGKRKLECAAVLFDLQYRPISVTG